MHLLSLHLYYRKESWRKYGDFNDSQPLNDKIPVINSSPHLGKNI